MGAGTLAIEYYLSDRLGEARTQSVAGRNKIEYSASKLAVRSDGYLHRCAQRTTPGCACDVGTLSTGHHPDKRVEHGTLRAGLSLSGRLRLSPASR